MKTISFTLMLATIVACAIGCASQNKDKSTFAADAKRSPTANTSYAFARILIGQGRDRDALYVLTRLVREHREFVPAYNAIGEIYMRSDRLDDAIGAVDSGLKQSPNDPILQNNLGMCRLLKGENEMALEAFTRAVIGSPNNPIYRANRAAAYALLGQTAAAEADYHLVLDNATTRENLAVLARAREKQPESAAATP